MTAISIPYTSPQPIHAHRLCDNEDVPQAHLYRQMVDTLNKTAYHQPKWFFHSPGRSAVIAAGGAGERFRWRFAGHTGLFCKNLLVSVEMALFGADDPYARALIAGGASHDFHYGNTTSTP